jgi:hypothetical protein
MRSDHVAFSGPPRLARCDDSLCRYNLIDRKNLCLGRDIGRNPSRSPISFRPRSERVERYCRPPLHKYFAQGFLRREKGATSCLVE